MEPEDITDLDDALTIDEWTSFAIPLWPEFKTLVLKSFPIGSRYVCDPPVMDTDKDTLILVANLAEAANALMNTGWEICGNGGYIDGIFMAFRKGEENYIVCKDEKFFHRYVLAAQVAKALNVQDKETRIKIHHACITASLGCIGLVQWDTGNGPWTTA